MSDRNGQTKILIVDEDPAMTDLLKMALEPLNYLVHTVNPNSKSIETIFNTYYDVVIVELLKPNQEGLDVCRNIRTISQVPIVVLSVVNKPGMVEQALDAGADDYLLKPVPTSVLNARLHTLARRARAEWEAANQNQSGGKTGAM